MPQRTFWIEKHGSFPSTPETRAFFDALWQLAESQPPEKRMTLTLPVPPDEDADDDLG